MKIALDSISKKKVIVRDVPVDSCATCAHCAGMGDCLGFCNTLIDREFYEVEGDCRKAMVFPNQICDYFTKGEQ